MELAVALDCHVWLDPRLEFLLDRWLEVAGHGRLEQLSIRHLPLFQLGCGEHQNVIVPIVFLKTDLQKVGQLAQLVLKDPSDTLRYSFTRLPSTTGILLHPIAICGPFNAVEWRSPDSRRDLYARQCCPKPA